MNYLGDFLENATVIIPFSTSAADGAAVAPSAPIDLADFDIYKSDSITQRSSTAGWTYTESFDGVTGISVLKIDLSDDTDSGFYAPENDYFVVLSPDTETIDGQTIAAVVAVFSIENRPPAGIEKFTCEGTPSTTVIQTDLAETQNDIYIGRTIIFLSGNARGEIGAIEDYVGATGTLTIATGDLANAPASGDRAILI